MRPFDLHPLDFIRNELSALWWWYVWQGAGLILLGIAVIVWPEFLTILAASFLIAAGSTLLLFAWRVRRIKRRYNTFLAIEPDQTISWKETMSWKGGDLFGSYSWFNRCLSRW